MKKQYILEYHPTGKIIEGKKTNNNYVFGFRYNKLLYRGKTKFQKIELYNTPWMGKLLLLDGCFQTSEKDEFFYHEAMTHPAMTSHPNPSMILIIGGGDGGILRHALTHKTVKNAILVEIDREVIEFSKKYLKFIHKNSYQNPKAKVYVGDGKKFIESTNKKFDIIISDLTDPMGPAKALFTKKFYQTISNHLAKNGIFSCHLDLVTTRPEIAERIYKNLKVVFKYTQPFVSYIPLYGSQMAFCLSSQTINPAKIKTTIIAKRLTARKVKNLKWYNPKMHGTLFILPPHLEKVFK